LCLLAACAATGIALLGLDQGLRDARDEFRVRPTNAEQTEDPRARGERKLRLAQTRLEELKRLMTPEAQKALHGMVTEWYRANFLREDIDKLAAGEGVLSDTQVVEEMPEEERKALRFRLIRERDEHIGNAIEACKALPLGQQWLVKEALEAHREANQAIAVEEQKLQEI
jgi:hypothetical protein